MKLDRRGFFGLSAGAAIATPAALREAASERAGLDQRFNVESGWSANWGDLEPVSNSENYGSVEWFKRQFSQLSGDYLKSTRMRTAKSQARQLDLDIASLHSVSPSVRYQMQVERCYQRLYDEEVCRIKSEMKDFKVPFLSVFGKG